MSPATPFPLYGTTKEPPPEPDILTPADVARELKVSLRWVNAALRSGAIECLSLGPRLRRVTRAQLEAYKARRMR